MDRIDEGYQWLEGIADRMKEEIGGGVAASPESLKVRELLWQFGFQRRGDWIIEGPADLTFGGHCRLLENRDNWEQLTLNVDRKVFVKCLHSVREIRNDVMHFNPDGLDDDRREELRDLARFFDKWRT